MTSDIWLPYNWRCLWELDKQNLVFQAFRSSFMANNDDITLSAIDDITTESVRRKDGIPAIPTIAGLETSARGLPRDARDKHARSSRRSVILEERRRQRDSHTQHLEDKLRDQDTIIKKMATEVEAMRRQMKGNGVARVRNHSEHAHSCRSVSQNRRRTPSLSVTRSFRAGDYVALTTTSHTQDSSYHPSRLATTSRYSRSDRSKDLRDVLEEGARQREAQRVPALQ